MSFRERLERNIVWWSIVMVALGFGGGIGAYQALLAITNQETVIRGTHMHIDEIENKYIRKDMVKENYISRSELEREYIGKKVVQDRFVSKTLYEKALGGTGNITESRSVSLPFAGSAKLKHQEMWTVSQLDFYVEVLSNGRPTELKVKFPGKDTQIDFYEEGDIWCFSFDQYKYGFEIIEIVDAPNYSVHITIDRHRLGC